VEYIHNEIGYNYRLTNIQAAMGVAQLEHLDEYVNSKRQTARYYTEHLANIPGITPPLEAEWAFSIFWLYTMLVDEKQYGMSARQLMHRLRAQGIQTRPFWHPIYSLPPYIGCQSYGVEVVDRLYERGLSLPCSVGIGETENRRVVRLVRKWARGG